jgi:hypothetical protein
MGIKYIFLNLSIKNDNDPPFETIFEIFVLDTLTMIFIFLKYFFGVQFIPPSPQFSGLAPPLST